MDTVIVFRCYAIWGHKIRTAPFLLPYYSFSSSSSSPENLTCHVKNFAHMSRPMLNFLNWLSKQKQYSIVKLWSLSHLTLGERQNTPWTFLHGGSSR